MVNIRKIGVSEAFVIQDLAHKIWPSTFSDILEPAQINYMLNWMYDIELLQQQMNDGHQFWLIENDEPLGFLGLELFYPSQNELKIHKLYILPNEQGKGLGAKLIKKAIKIAEKHHISSLLLNVNRFNPAVHFYTHLGFNIVREENIDIGEGYLMEDYVMTLEAH